MIDNCEKPKNDLSNSLILRGTDVCLLPKTLLLSYCEKVSIKLESSPYTINESPEALYEVMIAGNAVVAMDVFTNQLYGFGQVKKNSNKTWIFNSWAACVPGIGKPILLNAAALVHEIDPEAQVIAKVREGNAPAKKAINEMGGVLMGYESSEHIANPNTLQPIVLKSIYNVSLGKLLPSAPQRNRSSMPPKPEDYSWVGLSNLKLIELTWLAAGYKRLLANKETSTNL